MKKSRYTEEQIAFALRQAEGGTPVADVCRQVGVSEASFYVWKKKYGKLGLTEIRELRQLRDENARLKRLVADLTLDKHILGEVIAKKGSEARPASRAGGLDQGALSGGHGASLSAGALLARRVLPQEHGQGSVGIAVAHPGDRACAAPLRLPAHPRHAATRGLAGEQEAGSEAVSARRTAAAHTDSSPQAHVPASRSGTCAERAARAVEHGFRP
jgi:putative transposase